MRQVYGGPWVRNKDRTRGKIKEARGSNVSRELAQMSHLGKVESERA